MEKAKDYKKYLKTLKKITKPKGMDDLTRSRVGEFTVAGRIKKLLKKRRGGAMLKNPGKADLDKDGKLSGYEKKRGMAIEKAMGAKRGKFAKTRKKFGPDAEFKTYNQMRDLFDRQKKLEQRKKDMEKDKQKISEKKKGIAVKSGGMMKYNKGGGADTGTKGELKSRIGVATNKLKRVNRMLKRIGGRKAPKRPKLQAPERAPMKPLKAKEGKAVLDPKTKGALESMSSKNPMKRDRLREGVKARSKARRRKMFTDALRKLGAAGRSLTPGGAGSVIARKIGEKISKKMGGGMMMKPMGYKSGTSVMARGCKLGRKKPTKIM